jgi:hypothetical protein
LLAAQATLRGLNLQHRTLADPYGYHSYDLDVLTSASEDYRRLWHDITLLANLSYEHSTERAGIRVAIERRARAAPAVGFPS